METQDLPVQSGCKSAEWAQGPSWAAACEPEEDWIAEIVSRQVNTYALHDTSYAAITCRYKTHKHTGSHTARTRMY